MEKDLAIALKVKAYVWKCSKCGFLHLGDNPPRRCGNRKRCGRMLYQKSKQVLNGVLRKNKAA